MDKLVLSDIKISISDAAKAEINLIAQNDYTIEGQCLRLTISGKGCTGFDYGVGFGERRDDDFIYTNNDVEIHLDRFTAYYCRYGALDYIKDYKKNVEGFHFENANQKQYQGKFFKDESKVPNSIS